MTKPHKHSQLIKLWADGATIEYRQPASGGPDDGWITLDGPGGMCPPKWNEDGEYRVKPEPAVSPLARRLIVELVSATMRAACYVKGGVQQYQAYETLYAAERALYAYIRALENPK